LQHFTTNALQNDDRPPRMLEDADTGKTDACAPGSILQFRLNLNRNSFRKPLVTPDLTSWPLQSA